MSTTKPSSPASRYYNSAKKEAISAVQLMTQSMKAMGAEHVHFHNHFDDVQKQLQDMKEAYGGKELHSAVIQSTALDGYISEDNLLKVTALGHMELEKVLKDFQQQEQELNEIHKKTARLMKSLLGDRRCLCEDGHDARA